MPYQNRVNPAGDLLKISDRGAWMGNRGLLHNDAGEVVRHWKLKAWIICLLDFKERQRQVFTPRRYSELFFLDEATALSAGHRPCGECRYQDYRRFKNLWLLANSGQIENKSPKVFEIDKILHQERISKGGEKVTYPAILGALPDGTFVMLPNDPNIYLLNGKYFYKWSPAGYQSKFKKKLTAKVTVLTPYSIVKTLMAGYLPQIHPSLYLL